MTCAAGIRRVLVANRGEIAVRIVRACRDEGLEAIVAVSEADQDSLAARLATDVVHIGPASPTQSYLRVEQIVRRCTARVAAMRCIPATGSCPSAPSWPRRATPTDWSSWVRPRTRSGAAATRSRRAASHAPPASRPAPARMPSASADAALVIAAEVGYPVLLKAAAGGGGRGMVRVDEPSELADAIRHRVS